MMCGAIQVREKDGTEFKIGSGFTDKDRLNPPKIGSVVTFKY
jgi:DNA ligase-1